MHNVAANDVDFNERQSGNVWDWQNRRSSVSAVGRNAYYSYAPSRSRATRLAAPAAEE